MSSSTVCEPLRVVVKISRQEVCFLAFAHSLALWAIVQVGFYFLLPVLALSVVCYLRRWLCLTSKQLVILQDAFCWFEEEGMPRQHYQLGTRHFVCGFLVIVQLRHAQRRFAASRYLPVFSDAIDPDAFRRLRMLLYLNQRARPASSLVSE